MLKALIKKQFLELNTFYFQNKKTGKMRSKAGITGFVLLFVFLFLVIAGAFFGVSDMLGSALIPAGMAWLYFALMGMMAVALGVFGSVFNTYSGLYLSKDNDLLLSMPVPPSAILLSRMTGVYAMSLLYSAIAWIPAVIYYLLQSEASLRAGIFGGILTFFVALLVQVLTCILGWVVALIATRLKNKSAMTAVISVVLLGLYYFASFRFGDILKSLVARSGQLETGVRKWAYPFFRLGQAATGEVLPMLLFSGLALILFGICWYVMSRSLIRMVTGSRSGKKAVYREKSVRTRSIKSALFRRELKRFTSSATYMLNCGLGIILLPVLCVFAFIKIGSLDALLTLAFQTLPQAMTYVPVVIAAVVCLGISMNTISAPSVSLEGNSLWIARSLPVSAKDVLFAKQRLHVVLNSVPVLICTTLLGIALRQNALTVLCMMLCAMAFVWLCGAVGLFLGLKRPNINWTNETVPVKQSVSVVIMLFGGWIVSAAMGGLYYFAGKIMDPQAYLLLCAAALALIAWGTDRWIGKKGAEIFENL